MNNYYSISNIIERFIARHIAKKSGKSYHEVLLERDLKRRERSKRINLDLYIQHGAYR